MIRRFGGTLAALCLFLALTVPASAHEFTPGYYYATGTVQPLGFSIYMQGTHYLASASGGMISLLSSDYYDLSLYEGAKVTVSGWVEHAVTGSAVHMDVYYLTVLASGKVTVPFSILAQGSHTSWNTGPTTNRTIAIRDADTWEIFYRTHAPGATVPKVDFKKHQVVGAFAGVKPTGGYSITITKTEKSGTSLYVTTKSTSPAPGTIVTMALTNPFVLATTVKTTGKVHFNGKVGRVLTVKDFQTHPNSLIVLGHVTLGAGVDGSKVKVGTFSMDDRARYFVWPGMFPGNVSSLEFTGNFAKEFVPGMTDADPHVGFTVIVWEDLNGDNSTSGETIITSEGFRHMGSGSWLANSGETFTSPVRVELELIKE